MLKRIGIGVLAAIVLATSVAGIVLAQESTPPPDDEVPPGRFRGGQPQVLANALGIDVEEVHAALAGTIADLAEGQGMTVGDLADAIIAPMIERIQQAVDNGNITQEQADEQIAQMEERTLQGLESGSWFSMGRGGFRGDRHGAPLTALAEALDLTVDELHEALADGQTVAEVAEAQGVELEDLLDTLIAPMIERVQQAVDDGNMTQEQADERIAQMKEQMLEGLESGSGFGVGRGGFGGRPGGMRSGPWDDDAPSPRLPMQEAPSVTQ